MIASNLFHHLIAVMPGVTILVALVLVIRRPFTRYFGAQATYILWAAPVIRLFVPELKILPVLSHSHTTTTITESATVAPTGFGTFVNEPLIYVAPAQSSVDVAANSLANFVTTTSLIELTFLIWLYGCGLWIVQSVIHHYAFHRNLTRNSDLISKSHLPVPRQFSRRSRLRKAPEFRLAKDASGPLTTGIFNPIILLPNNFLTDYSVQEQELALAHELSHIERNDLTAALASQIMQIMLWPNPLIHFAYRAFRIDLEAACDAHVLAKMARQSAKTNQSTLSSYASALLKSAQSTTQSSGQSTIPHYPALALGHPLKERLMTLKNLPNKKHSQSIGNIVATASIIAGLFSTAAYGRMSETTVDIDKTETKEMETGKSGTTNSHRTVTITGDKGDKITLNGFARKGITKIVYEEKNGSRNLKVYDKRNKRLLNKEFKKGEAFTYDPVTIVEKNGTVRTLNMTEKFDAVPLAPLPPTPPIMTGQNPGTNTEVIIIQGTDGTGQTIKREILADEIHELSGDIDSWVIDTECEVEILGPNASAPNQSATKSKKKVTVKKMGDHTIISQHDCMTNMSSSDDPEALRAAIAKLEEKAKRDAEQAKATIEQLKQRVKEIEQAR